MRRVNISTARRELPALFDRVTENEGETVVIGRRDGGVEAVLVSRGYIERLERARLPSASREFRVPGSITSSAPSPIDDIRAAAREESDRRVAELAPRPSPPRSRSRR